MYGSYQRDWVKLDPQDGTNCRSCGMTSRDCVAAEPGEVDVRCCDTCNHGSGLSGHGVESGAE
jgi:hypothetical protein